MADKSAEADVRSLFIDKLVRAYEEEASIFKKYVTQTTIPSRTIRWFQKTAGIISGVTTSGITTSLTTNTATGALPPIAEQGWTRNESDVRTYTVETPFISNADIKDNDVNLLVQNARDLALRIAYDVDTRIWDVISESRSATNINSNATAAAWDTASYTSVNIVEDLMEAKQNIRVNSGFSPEGAVLFLSPKDHRSMMNWLIDGKGSSIPQFASRKIEEGVVMHILGLRVIVSNNVTADYALVMIPNLAATWYSFTPLTSAIIEEPLVGKKVRVIEEGECTLDRPKCINLITNTQA